MTTLITGGAGYIGSHIAHQLNAKSKSFVVVDNLSTGFLDSLPKNCSFYEGDFSDIQLLKKIYNIHKFDSVIHLAAKTRVEESIKDPILYFQENTSKTIELIKFCIQTQIKNIIFSSTAAVYGSVPEGIVNEESPLSPISPYGWSKLFVERILKNCQLQINSVILRYFNVAGAHSDGLSGQSTPNATHLIKVAAQTALGLQKEIQIYGNDYPTKDGTCIRDYIHVEDLTQAHILSLEYLENNNSSQIFNCGYGSGFSVKEVLETMKIISQNNFKVSLAKRRPGDPPCLISNSEKIMRYLNWQPAYNDIQKICKSSFEWEKKLSLKMNR